MIAHRRQQASSPLRVSLPVSLGRRWALPALLDVAQRHPLLRLDLSFTDRRSDLVDEGIDRAVRIGDPGGRQREPCVPRPRPPALGVVRVARFLSFTDRRSDLVDEGIDRAVRIGDPRGGSASLACRGLGRRRSAPCASPAYLARRGRSRRSGAGARRRTPAPGGRRLGDRLSAHGLSKSGLIGLNRAGRALA
ncbi:LysR substrate-binding domain-containing protein [Burkholderia pseudomallei]|uniref:LysR substrate-binding domain-containing protein n=2 Tax=Burkholderia pseudomallei TaxID=28450 RepID=UPI0003F78B28|nr:LysR substrate-binding domain-containing protein [Burkholderia pseudomallei]MCE2035004.1 aldo/keto reductase [Burkholderia pseudomallei CS]MCE2041000.1 aldo/keto reductase [Burkholderia pseudomallei CB]MCE2047199.1 aldo/keto reductase [Burkholderia pseudomallei OS]MCE2053238.1 aldo/keto reductase [Burkholderia pseudomallei OB]KIX55869.1 aldo/keto reductase [Burkholderia pseudomallei]